MKDRILIVEDENNLRKNLQFILQKEGFSTQGAENGLDALKELSEYTYDLVLCDIRLPKMNGLDLLKKVKEMNWESKFIMMTAYGSIDSAVEAIKLGADEYITKPFINEEIVRVIKKTLHLARLEDDHKRFKDEIKKKYELKKNIIGSSKTMQEVFNKVDKVSRVYTPVLITGENGTGKELIARAIHSYSDQATGPFIAANCAAIPENLFESEFFGYEKGAFTGAISSKKGCFEEADGGTLVLDEIGELPLHMQSKLLRVLQENEVKRIGGTKTIPFEARIVSCSNKNLDKLVREGRFRQDLYYRIKVVTIEIPPLRERDQDIALLIDYFIEKYAQLFKRNINGISSSAKKMLVEYQWPGNVRQLEHVIQSAVVMADCEILDINDFEPLKDSDRGYDCITDANSYDLKGTLEELKRRVEKDMVSRALEATKGNRVKAAQLLGISHRSVLYKLKEYHLDQWEDK